MNVTVPLRADENLLTGTRESISGFQEPLLIVGILKSCFPVLDTADAPGHGAGASGHSREPSAGTLGLGQQRSLPSPAPWATADRLTWEEGAEGASSRPALLRTPPELD